MTMQITCDAYGRYSVRYLDRVREFDDLPAALAYLKNALAFMAGPSKD